MEAVTDDHGTWEDPADYFASPLYGNKPGKLRLWLYRHLVRGINGKVAVLRRRGSKDSARAGSDSLP
jgi:hypothetical protein